MTRYDDAVLSVLASGPQRLGWICDALAHEPGYWDEWPTVERVLKALAAEGQVVRQGHYWVLADDSARSASA